MKFYSKRKNARQGRAKKSTYAKNSRGGIRL